MEAAEALAPITRSGGARAAVAEVVKLAALREPPTGAAPDDAVALVEYVLSRSMAGQLSRLGSRAWRWAALASASRDKRLHIGGGGGAVHGDPLVVFL